MVFFNRCLILQMTLMIIELSVCTNCDFGFQLRVNSKLVVLFGRMRQIPIEDLALKDDILQMLIFKSITARISSLMQYLHLRPIPTPASASNI